MTPLEKRFWSKVSFPAGGVGCWLWTAAKDKTGYGRFGVGSRVPLAHHVAYHLCVGEIPAGFELDHVKARGCTNHNCVNPAHLEPVTHRENIIRGDGPEILGARNRAKTHCPAGHPYNAENTYPMIKLNGRACKICRRLACRRSRARAKGKL